MLIYDYTLSGEADTGDIESICYWLKHEADCIDLLDSRKPLHSRYCSTCHDVEIWYDFGADYYFFAEGAQ